MEAQIAAAVQSSPPHLNTGKIGGFRAQAGKALEKRRKKETIRSGGKSPLIPLTLAAAEESLPQACMGQQPSLMSASALNPV